MYIYIQILLEQEKKLNLVCITNTQKQKQQVDSKWCSAAQRIDFESGTVFDFSGQSCKVTVANKIC